MSCYTHFIADEPDKSFGLMVDGRPQFFATSEKREAYQAWHQNLRNQVDQERQRIANERARRAQSDHQAAEAKFSQSFRDAEDDAVRARL